MSHQVQLSPTASHHPPPSWTRPGTPLSSRPAAADVRTPRPDRTCAGYFPPLEIRSARASFTPPPKMPGQARGPAGRTNPRGPADLATCPLADPISRKEEATRGHRGDLARRVTYRAIRQRSASKAHDRDRPARYPGATSQGPAPPPDAGQAQRPRRPPILHDMRMLGLGRVAVHRSRFPITHSSNSARQGSGQSLGRLHGTTHGEFDLLVDLAGQTPGLILRPREVRFLFDACHRPVPSQGWCVSECFDRAGEEQHHSMRNLHSRRLRSRRPAYPALPYCRIPVGRRGRV